MRIGKTRETRKAMEAMKTRKTRNIMNKGKTEQHGRTHHTNITLQPDNIQPTTYTISQNTHTTV